MTKPCDQCDARRVLLAELDRVGVNVSDVPPHVLSTVVWRIVVGASTVAHAVEFFQAGERCRAATARGEISDATARLIMRQLGARQRGAGHGN